MCKCNKTKKIAVFLLGLAIFGALHISGELHHPKQTDEPVKLQIVDSYFLVPIMNSGSASTVAGPIKFVKL